MKIILYKLEFFLSFSCNFLENLVYFQFLFQISCSQHLDISLMSWISKRWKIQGIPPLNISQYVAERIKKQKKAKNKFYIVKKCERRTSILVPNGMPYTRLYGWYQAFARIAQCPGREASLQQALALPQEVRSRREALPTSTLIAGWSGDGLKIFTTYHWVKPPKQPKSRDTRTKITRGLGTNSNSDQGENIVQ